MRMYFKSQKIVIPATVISAFMVIFNLIINLILVFGYGLNWIPYFKNFKGFGFTASPIATAITRNTQFLIYFIWMFKIRKHHRKTWSNIYCFANNKKSVNTKLSVNVSSQTFSMVRVKQYLKVGIPQTISSAVEEWQIQIITLFAAQLSFVSLCCLLFCNV